MSLKVENVILTNQYINNQNAKNLKISIQKNNMLSQANNLLLLTVMVCQQNGE